MSGEPATVRRDAASLIRAKSFDLLALSWAATAGYSCAMRSALFERSASRQLPTARVASVDQFGLGAGRLGGTASLVAAFVGGTFAGAAPGGAALGRAALGKAALDGATLGGATRDGVVLGGA